MFLIWISYELLQAQKWWDFQPETPLSLIPLCCFRLLIRQTQNSFLVCDGSDFVVQFMLKFIFTYLLQFNIWLHHLLLLTFSFFFHIYANMKNVLIVCSLDWKIYSLCALLTDIDSPGSSILEGSSHHVLNLTWRYMLNWKRSLLWSIWRNLSRFSSLRSV